MTASKRRATAAARPAHTAPPASPGVSKATRTPPADGRRTLASPDASPRPRSSRRGRTGTQADDPAPITSPPRTDRRPGRAACRGGLSGEAAQLTAGGGGRPHGEPAPPPPPPIHALSGDALGAMLGLLPQEEFARAALVCKDFHAALRANGDLYARLAIDVRRAPPSGAGGLAAWVVRRAGRAKTLVLTLPPAPPGGGPLPAPAARAVATAVGACAAPLPLRRAPGDAMLFGGRGPAAPADPPLRDLVIEARGPGDALAPLGALPPALAAATCVTALTLRCARFAAALPPWVGELAGLQALTLEGGHPREAPGDPPFFPIQMLALSRLTRLEILGGGGGGGSGGGAGGEGVGAGAGGPASDSEGEGEEAEVGRGADDDDDDDRPVALGPADELRAAMAAIARAAAADAMDLEGGGGVPGAGARQALRRRGGGAGPPPPPPARAPPAPWPPAVAAAMRDFGPQARPRGGPPPPALDPAAFAHLFGGGAGPALAGLVGAMHGAAAAVAAQHRGARGGDLPFPFGGPPPPGMRPAWAARAAGPEAAEDEGDEGEEEGEEGGGTDDEEEAVARGFPPPLADAQAAAADGGAARRAVAGGAPRRGPAAGRPGRVSIPPVLGELRALRSLTVRGARGLAVHPSAFQRGAAAAASLVELALVDCGLTSVPHQVAGMDGLTRLDVSGNRGLSALPPLLAPGVRGLRALAAASCDLARLPPALTRLTGLTALDLSDNPRLQVGGGEPPAPLAAARREVSLAQLLAALPALGLLDLRSGPGGGLVNGAPPSKRWSAASLAQLRLVGAPPGFGGDEPEARYVLVRAAFKDGRCEAVPEGELAGQLRLALARIGGEAGTARAAGALAVRHFDAVAGLAILRVGQDVLKEFRLALPRVTAISHRAVALTTLRVCGRPASVRSAAAKAAAAVPPVGRVQTRLRAEAATKLADVEL